MAIDVGALRRFQETWGPVLDAIPAVVNMAEQQADLDRALAKKRIELTAATKEVEAAFAEADVRLEAVNKELTAVLDQKSATLAEIGNARTQADVAAKAAEVDAKKRLDAITQKVDVKSAELATVDAKIVAETNAALAEHAKAVAAMSAEIQDLEKRKAAAEKALDTLRAKLG